MTSQLPQARRTEQLSGTKKRTSITVLLRHAVDGRHVAVSVIVLVQEHGLVQLQFEFASDIDTESQVGFSRLSMMVLIRTTNASSCINVSITATRSTSVLLLPGRGCFSSQCVNNSRL